MDRSDSGSESDPLIYTKYKNATGFLWHFQSAKNCFKMSLRTSPLAGVAISSKKGEYWENERKLLDDPGDSHASVRTGSE